MNLLFLLRVHRRRQKVISWHFDVLYLPHDFIDFFLFHFKMVIYGVKKSKTRILHRYNGSGIGGFSLLNTINLKFRKNNIHVNKRPTYEHVDLLLFISRLNSIVGGV